MRPGERKLWTEAIGQIAAEKLRRTFERPRSKMGNRIVRVDGRRFDSQLEADRYLELKALKLAGEVRFFLRQVPFEIAPRVTCRVDFQVHWRDPQKALEGERALEMWDGQVGVLVTHEDTKGFLTETARVKLAAVRELYGVHVRLLRRADVKRMRS